jgi:hypothetical protein
VFETERDVLDWYERQPRALTAEFLRGLDRGEAARHPLDPAFVPVLEYMRDVESYTEVYHKELLRTPTGRDPVIGRFMERWVAEEDDHGELLNRFLAEAGAGACGGWRERARAAIPVRYTLGAYASTFVTNLFGRGFGGAHMVWGAINELTTLQGYRRLWESARHPLLEKILRAVAREESAHANFYWAVARVKLLRSRRARWLARAAVERFWTPVGEGAKPRRETDYVIGTLFGGRDGLDLFEARVARRVRALPGFENLQTLTRRMAEVGASA